MLLKQLKWHHTGVRPDCQINRIDSIDNKETKPLIYKNLTE